MCKLKFRLEDSFDEKGELCCLFVNLLEKL